jgi:uncharacterized membrane protein
MTKEDSTAKDIRDFNDATAEQPQEIKSSLDFTRSTTDHVAVFITQTLGSMLFLTCCIILFIVWICLNLGLLQPLKPFDPFPFPILDMAVSIFAVILSVSVLINQNRQGRIEKISKQVEFEINVRAEHEITKVLTMLHEIHLKLGLGEQKADHELEEMKEQIDIKQLHQAIDEDTKKG